MLRFGRLNDLWPGTMVEPGIATHWRMLIRSSSWAARSNIDCKKDPSRASSFDFVEAVLPFWLPLVEISDTSVFKSDAFGSSLRIFSPYSRCFRMSFLCSRMSFVQKWANFCGIFSEVTSFTRRMRTPVRMMQRMLTRVRTRLIRPR